MIEKLAETFQCESKDVRFAVEIFPVENKQAHQKFFRFVTA